MVQLEGTENRISYSRQRYIQAVAEYNFGIRRFPNNLIANWAGYKTSTTSLKFVRYSPYCQNAIFEGAWNWDWEDW
jgi:hypothetical protein